MNCDLKAEGEDTRTCGTKPIWPGQGEGGTPESERCKTNPIRWADHAKQSQFDPAGGRAAVLGKGEYTKQSQSARAERSWWGKPHPTPGCNCAKQTPFQRAARMGTRAGGTNKPNWAKRAKQSQLVGPRAKQSQFRGQVQGGQRSGRVAAASPEAMRRPCRWPGGKTIGKLRRLRLPLPPKRSQFRAAGPVGRAKRSQFRRSDNCGQVLDGEGFMAD